MRPDRTWMLRRHDCTGRVSDEYMNGVEEFIKIASMNPTIVDALSRILCPCSRCKNRVRKELFWIEKDLYQYGFMEGYINWTVHGEDRWGDISSSFVVHDEVQNGNPYVDMVRDAAGDRLNFQSQDVEEDPNPDASKFYDLLRDADEPLWDADVGRKNRAAMPDVVLHTGGSVGFQIHKTRMEAQLKCPVHFKEVYVQIYKKKDGEFV